MVAIGFGCLEAVLDKGQEDDWFGSRFIIVFFTIAAVCLVCAFFWELHVDDPVVDIRLLKNRNFAIACGLYTVFGFALFGSTVLLPQLMQTLFGYTATDAGMVLSPGALVVMCMAPMTPRLLKYIQPKWLVLGGLVLLAMSLQYMTGFSLDLDYRTAAHARMFQGVGIGLLFVPVSQIAYSYLPKDKNNQGVQHHQPLPQPGRQLRHRVCNHNARPAKSIPSIHPHQPRHTVQQDRQYHTEHAANAVHQRRHGNHRRPGTGAGNAVCDGAKAGSDAVVHRLLLAAVDRLHDRSGAVFGGETISKCEGGSGGTLMLVIKAHHAPWISTAARWAFSPIHADRTSSPFARSAIIDCLIRRSTPLYM